MYILIGNHFFIDFDECVAAEYNLCESNSYCENLVGDYTCSRCSCNMPGVGYCRLWNNEFKECLGIYTITIIIKVNSRVIINVNVFVNVKFALPISEM